MAKSSNVGHKIPTKLLQHQVKFLIDYETTGISQSRLGGNQIIVQKQQPILSNILEEEEDSVFDLPANEYSENSFSNNNSFAFGSKKPALSIIKNIEPPKPAEPPRPAEPTKPSFEDLAGDPSEMLKAMNGVISSYTNFEEEVKKEAMYLSETLQSARRTRNSYIVEADSLVNNIVNVTRDKAYILEGFFKEITQISNEMGHQGEADSAVQELGDLLSSIGFGIKKEIAFEISDETLLNDIDENDFFA